jgi:hypothetical protein
VGAFVTDLPGPGYLDAAQQVLDRATAWDKTVGLPSVIDELLQLSDGDSGVLAAALSMANARIAERKACGHSMEEAGNLTSTAIGMAFMRAAKAPTS